MSLNHLRLSLACEVQVAEWYGKTAPQEEDAAPAGTTGIKRIDWKLETMHGKNICDPLGNMPSRTLQEAVERDDMINVGTREVYFTSHAIARLQSLLKWSRMAGELLAEYSTRITTTVSSQL